MNNYAAGMRGQRAAEEFLLGAGYEIVERNYRVQGGEIDIIARVGERVVFVEVKFRSGTGYGLGSEAVGAKKRLRITRTALHYIAAQELDSQDFRFDVIDVLEKDGRMYINHIQDAFWV